MRVHWAGVSGFPQPVEHATPIQADLSWGRGEVISDIARPTFDANQEASARYAGTAADGLTDVGVLS